MREKLYFFYVIISVLMIICSDLPAQSVPDNKPMINESEASAKTEPVAMKIRELEIRHKMALESGNEALARSVENEISGLIPENSKLLTGHDGNNAIVRRYDEEPAEDWLNAGYTPTIFAGSPRADSIYYRKLDIKKGPDNNLYSVIATHAYTGAGYGGLAICRSTNGGMNWSQLYGIGFPGEYLGNMSMTVESRNDLNPDSVRIIIFYTSSTFSNLKNSSLKYFSIRASDDDYSYGTIMNPSSGNSIAQVSAVSDGEFFENATYFGAVVSEIGNDDYQTKSLRFIRTANWGVTWTSVNFETTFNDCFPYAEYKRGPSDSIYIAVERRFETNTQIRVIATSWSPSVNYRTIYITSDPGVNYRKPVIAIKTDPPVDSMMISYTKNNLPLYAFSKDGGKLWTVNNVIDPVAIANVRYTHCSSARYGNEPFTVCWLNQTADTLSITNGPLGNFGPVTGKINSYPLFSSILPVSLTTRSGNINGGAVAFYTSESPNDKVRFTSERLKLLVLKVILQGAYNTLSNIMNNPDTVRVYLRQNAAPFTIVDSAKVKISAFTFTSDIFFRNATDGQYYIEIRHRNSLQTWSKDPVNFATIGYRQYDFTTSQETAYGNNQAQVDVSPSYYGIYGGDVNQDGSINLTDLVSIFNDASDFTMGYVNTDVNIDNSVNLADMTVAYNNSALFVSKKNP